MQYTSTPALSLALWLIKFWLLHVAGSRLRRNLMAEGGVAPVAATANAAMAAAQNLGGMEEKFAFKRAVSRLHEMQSNAYLGSRRRA